MFNITKGDTLIATVDRLSFVRRQDNGVIVNCTEADAQGIVYGDTFYHLPYLPALLGAEDVSVDEFNGAQLLTDIQEAANG